MLPLAKAGADTMKDSFKHLTAVSPEGLSAYLKALAEGAETGSLPLTESGRTFALTPQGLIDLGLKVRRKNGRARLTLDLAWAEPGAPDNEKSRP